MNFNQPNTISCKPIVTSSCQQFLKFEIHNSNLSSSFTWQILALVRALPLNAMLEIIYLKHKLSNNQTQAYASQQWLVVVSNLLNPKFSIRILTTYYAYSRQILAVVRNLPLTVMFEIIYLKHKLQTTKHKIMRAKQ